MGGERPKKNRRIWRYIFRRSSNSTIAILKGGDPIVEFGDRHFQNWRFDRRIRRSLFSKSTILTSGDRRNPCVRIVGDRRISYFLVFLPFVEIDNCDHNRERGTGDHQNGMTVVGSPLQSGAFLDCCRVFWGKWVVKHVSSKFQALFLRNPGSFWKRINAKITKRKLLAGVGRRQRQKNVFGGDRT